MIPHGRSEALVPKRPARERRAPSVGRDFESALVAFAQGLVVDEPLAGHSDRFARRIAECLRARHPALPARDLARCVLIARRACVCETLEGD